jgi:hypothetical protein
MVEQNIMENIRYLNDKIFSHLYWSWFFLFLIGVFSIFLHTYRNNLKQFRSAAKEMFKKLEKSQKLVEKKNFARDVKELKVQNLATLDQNEIRIVCQQLIDSKVTCMNTQSAIQRKIKDKYKSLEVDSIISHISRKMKQLAQDKSSQIERVNKRLLFIPNIPYLSLKKENLRIKDYRDPKLKIIKTHLNNLVNYFFLGSLLCLIAYLVLTFEIFLTILRQNLMLQQIDKKNYRELPLLWILCPTLIRSEFSFLYYLRTFILVVFFPAIAILLWSILFLT